MNIASLLERTLQPSHPPGRLVGYLGHDVPVELVLAAGALPIGLHGRADRPTPSADRYLESTFSPASRAVAEQWLNGELDDLEAVIFSRSDDSAQRLYYYLCELLRRGQCRGPKPLLYDIATCDRPSSLAYTVDSTRLLARQLGTWDNALPNAVQRVHERMRLLAQTADRPFSNQPARGSLTQRILRAADRNWSEDFDQALHTAHDPSPASAGAIRLMLIGSTPADEQLHEAAERAGANIVATLNAATPEDHNHVAENVDAFARIARRCRTSSWREMLRSPQVVCTRAVGLQVSGVILWTLAEDSGLAWAAPRIERALAAQGIAVLALPVQPWNVPAATLDAVAHFATALKAGA
ncbi:MAG TPA: 2-hydroxyacyl-CoA dehydratase family protein [Steroidobacter sp.]